jgi:mannose-6-phosphate isomerase-like protein (cupin superfamily)
MSNASMLVAVILLCAQCAHAQSAPPEGGPPPLVLQKNEGERRTRRPREGERFALGEYLIKVSPKTNGSKHLLLFTGEIPPGGRIPKHKHHGEDEILLIQTGNAHVWLGDKEYDVQPGGLIFIPSGTWIALKNTGKENISSVAVWNEPGFEELIRCVSVPKGQPAKLQSLEEARECYQHGDAELGTAQPSAEKKP